MSKSGTKNRQKVQRLQELETMNFTYSSSYVVPNSKVCSNLNMATALLKEKIVTRVSPNIQRSACPRCKVLLIPGNTAVIRIRSNKSSKFRMVRCLLCSHTSRYALQHQELKIDSCTVVDVDIER